MNKDCSICVYNGVCEGRLRDASITDCCIPEQPLRQAQQRTVDAETFIFVTNKYIREYKSQSEYWKKQLN